MIGQNVADLNLSTTRYERDAKGQVDAVVRDESEIRVTARNGLQATQVRAERFVGAAGAKAVLVDTFNLDYDINGRLSSIDDGSGRNLAGYSKDPESGRLTQYTEPNGVDYHYTYRGDQLTTGQGQPSCHQSMQQ